MVINIKNAITIEFIIQLRGKSRKEVLKEILHFVITGKVI